jgi:hypothetical protein
MDNIGHDRIPDQEDSYRTREDHRLTENIETGAELPGRIESGNASLNRIQNTICSKYK